MSQPELGVSLHCLTGELTEEALAAVGRSQIATLEIFPTLLAGDQDKAALTKMLRESGIRPMTVHALFGGKHDISVLDASARREAVASTAQAVALAVDLGAPMVVVHASGEPILPEERGRRFDAARDSLSELGRVCRPAGKRIAVEVLPRSCIGNTTQELLSLLEGLPEETFGVCLDTNHLMDRWRSLPDDIRRLGSRLITTHLSDYDGVDEQHWMPGRGVLDWPAMMAAFREIGYAGPLNYECRPGGETVQERIEALEANFAGLIAR